MKTRRTFLSRLGIGATALGGLWAVADSEARAQAASDTVWKPMHHPQDDWFDQVAGKHRIFFDTTTPAELADAILFANNYLTASKSGYGLDPGDLAMIIGLRHQSAPFAFTDPLWSKHGVVLSNRAKFVDPKTNAPATTNVRA